LDPDSKGSDFDWWSKYYASTGDETLIQTEYIDAHHDTLQVGTGIEVSAQISFCTANLHQGSLTCNL